MIHTYKSVFGGLLLAGYLIVARLPKVRRLERAQRPLTYWLIIGLGVAGAIVLTLVISRH